jgi:hypothetical protein
MTRHSLRNGLIAFAVSLAGCAGSAGPDSSAADAGSGGGSQHGAAGSGGGMACPDPNEAIDPTALIDDMEDQNSAISPIDGRSGGWWTAGDETPSATIVPPQGSPALPELVPGGRCGSQYAMRVTGQGFSEWGALLGLNLAYDASGGVFYDASLRQGIGFWARIGDTSTNQMRLALSDINSEPKGGMCSENGEVGQSCFDTFGVTISSLGTTWRYYKVPFSGLTQRYFGLPAEELDTSALYTVGFNIEANMVFDLWIDDVSFY